MTFPIVLSYVQASQFLHAYRAGQSVIIGSSDLGLTSVEVRLSPTGITFPDKTQLIWEDIERVGRIKNTCFIVQDGRLHPIQKLSCTTNRFCSLMPTESAPTLLIAGFPMHRIKNTNPYRDTLSKIKSIAPIIGNVLDTTTGLGYTAIEMSRDAERVITVELDPTVIEIARQNPWSRRLFANPKIAQLIGDSCNEIESMDDSLFSRIIHDPPTFALAGDLYSGAFYRQLFRVLRRHSRLFHYVGDLQSGSGHGVAQGVTRRLYEAGFVKVRPCPEAFGLVAYK